MSDWRRRPAVAIFAISLFLVVQFAIPVSRLSGVSSGSRFGWQMFSSYQPQPQFTVETEGGLQRIDLDDITARLRADLDLEAMVPPFLCDRVEGAVRITWADGAHEC